MDRRGIASSWRDFEALFAWAWNDLEELHQDVVADATVGIDTVWIINGPIFEDTDGDGDDDPQALIGNDVGVPQATFKVIGWFDDQNVFQARGYVVRQTDRVRNDPAHYLRVIDEIEAATGFDFFPELDDVREQVMESATNTTLWGNVGGGGGGVTDVRVRIASLLPNPVGNESQNEAVTLRNVGTDPALLNGWRLRDAAGRFWNLGGTLDPGDETTVTRNGQPMALNNGGDTVELLNADGTVMDTVTYGTTQDGVPITVL